MTADYVGDMRKTSDVLWQDTQHQVLFDILDQIRQPNADAGLIESLREYTENHFTLEEEYMRQLEYPDIEAHMRAHDRFRREIDEVLTGTEHDAQFRDIIGTFLTEWLTRHVFGVDKKLEDFLLQSGVR